MIQKWPSTSGRNRTVWLLSVLLFGVAVLEESDGLAGILQCGQDDGPSGVCIHVVWKQCPQAHTATLLSPSTVLFIVSGFWQDMQEVMFIAMPLPADQRAFAKPVKYLIRTNFKLIDWKGHKIHRELSFTVNKRYCKFCACVCRLIVQIWNEERIPQACCVYKKSPKMEYRKLLSEPLFNMFYKILFKNRGNFEGTWRRFLRCKISYGSNIHKFSDLCRFSLFI